MPDREIDITRNVRTIEWLKCEILTDISNLYRLLSDGAKDELYEDLTETSANIILLTYLLSRRLGLSYSALQNMINSKIKLGLVENHDIEKYYGDLTELSKHFNKPGKQP